MGKFYCVDTDKEQICVRAADYWLQYYAESALNEGYFFVALSGGSTPKTLYQLLASAKYNDQIDWKRVQIFFGDERCVPLNHPDSNYLMAKTALLDHIDIPPQNIHPVPYEPQTPQRSAEAYQHRLSEILPSGPNKQPQFDLVLLGMGDDGHTASLFPATTILQETQRSVSEVHVKQLQTWRVSITYPVINTAKKILVLVSGASKADKIAEIFTLEKPESVYPIQAIEPKGDMIWLLDDDAASKLDNDTVLSDMTKIV